MTLRVKLPDGKYNIDLDTPPSGNGPRIRIDGTTYEILSVDPSDPDATNVRFYHPTEGTLAWKGGRVPLTYTHLVGSNHSPSDGFTWEDWDLTTYGVPGNCVAEILAYHPRNDAGAALEGKPGVREKGSALNRRAILFPYQSTAQTVVFRVNVDEDGVIEVYDNYLVSPPIPHCVFRVIGYFEGASYTETYIKLNSDDGNWDEDNLFTDHSIPKGSVIDVLMGAGTEDYGPQEIGIRSKGAAGRTYLMKDVWYDYGFNTVSVFETTNASNGKIETYCEDASEATFYCMGYWEAVVEYTVVHEILVPSGASSWVDYDLDTHSVPEGAVGVFVLFNREHETSNICGVRDDGSSLTRYVGIDWGEYVNPDYYATCVTMCNMTMGADSRVELYTTDTTYAYMYIDGYLTIS